VEKQLPEVMVVIITRTSAEEAVKEFAMNTEMNFMKTVDGAEEEQQGMNMEMNFILRLDVVIAQDGKMKEMIMMIVAELVNQAGVDLVAGHRAEARAGVDLQPWIRKKEEELQQKVGVPHMKAGEVGAAEEDDFKNKIFNDQCINIQCA
jgi:hypothetical protein